MMRELAILGNEWCILRTSGPRTLTLAKSLREVGIDAWAPEEVNDRRVPRSHKRVERTQAIVPSFVFAASRDLVNLIGIAAVQEIPGAPARHPPFTVMRFNGNYPLITDGSLDPLRRIEHSRKSRRALKERKHRQFEAGSSVRTKEGPFEGMTGIVEDGAAGFTMVCFPGFSISIKIATWLLAETDIHHPLQAHAA